MSRTVITTSAAPKAIGPYSQAIRSGDLLFCSGQLALDPVSGQMVGGGDVAAETRQVLANLTAVLKEAGAGWGDVVRTTIFLADFGDFATVNAIYSEVIVGPPPARVTIEVSRLPKDARIEIDAIARVGG
jgi:2-iminobutanoate/2-iminopropanoate deaminase